MHGNLFHDMMKIEIQNDTKEFNASKGTGLSYAAPAKKTTKKLFYYYLFPFCVNIINDIFQLF